MHPLLQDATDEQRVVIKHLNGPAFVSAAPGSGKSFCVTRRIAYLIDQGVDPNNIIGITFTNKAANVMKERVKKLVDPRLGRCVWLSTFHSLCVRLLRADYQFYGVRKNFGIADEADAKQTLTLAMAKVTGVSEKDVKKKSGAGDVGHVRRWISAQKDLVLTPGDVERIQEETPGKIKFTQFVPYYREYQRLLRKNNLLDFDDLIVRVVRKLRRSEEKQKFFAKHLHYLMVDEYQDTNFAQFELIRLMSKFRKNVVVVGDSDQSVYGWRGADIHNADRFYSSFEEAKTYMLQINFRSTPGIAAAANRVIQNNQRLHAKEIVANRKDGPGPLVVETENVEEEAKCIINSIRDFVRKGQYTWKDFAVIYRIRSLSRSLEDEAVARNIPYRVIGSINFYSRAHIKDILAYCRLVVYPHDDSAFTRIYNKPTRGIGPVNFARFAAEADKHEFSLMKTLRKGMYVDVVNSTALSGYRKLKSLYRELRKGDPRKSAAPFIKHIILNSGYRYMAENIKEEERSERMKEDLDELITAATTYDELSKGKRGQGLAGFLEHAALMQQNDKRGKQEEDNSVTFLTGHAAKGMEFPVVFVRGAVNGIMPLNPRSDDGDELSTDEVKQHFEEERRVFYVAITRAEERLFVTYPLMRRMHGGAINCSPSQFIREAGDTLSFVSLVDQNKTLQAGTTNKRYLTRTKRNKLFAFRTPPDPSVDQLLRLRERKRMGTATKGDLEALAAEEARMRSVVEDAEES